MKVLLVCLLAWVTWGTMDQGLFRSWLDTGLWTAGPSTTGALDVPHFENGFK